jgi:alpha-galactosidase
MYSGNFMVEAEITETDRLRFNIGINPMCLRWHLMPRKSCACFFALFDPDVYLTTRNELLYLVETEFNTPEAVLTRSSEGLGGLSRAIHRLFLDRLLPRNWSDENPPVLLNTWEAKYFNVNHRNLLEMTHQVSSRAPPHDDPVVAAVSLRSRSYSVSRPA